MTCRFKLNFVMGLSLLCFGVSPLIAADGPAVADKPLDAAAQYAAMIDRHLDDRFEQENITPAPRSSDEEFLRRVHLDVIGRIPSVAETRAFLNDTDPDKRRKLVKRLLDDAGYVTNFGTFWRKVLLPETETDFGTRFQIPGFEAWLRDRLTENLAYNDLVYNLLTAPVDGQTVSPTAFYSAKEIKPENLAASTSRMFLGVRLECAQCHNHPFDRWEQKEFWSFAAFFAGMDRQNGRNGNLGAIRELFSRRTLMIPDSDTIAYPAYLDGGKPRMGLGDSSRNSLASWVTAKDNPYFARMAVNRLWDHFFGRGIVAPVDDFGDNNPPSHPELLNEMGAGFAANGFDLKFLIEAITMSEAYQRASIGESDSQPYHFAKMPVKGLGAEQIFNSLAQAVGHQTEFNPRETYDFSFQANTPKANFVDRFTDENPNLQERQTTVLQALALMNGDFIANATKLEGSKTLAAITLFPGLSAEEQVEALFLATLTRKPTPEEQTRFASYVQTGGARNDAKEALADVFWVLLNTSEFLFNH